MLEGPVLETRRLHRGQLDPAQLTPGMQLDAAALRNHIPLILAAFVRDLRTPQTPGQQRVKSEGRAPAPGGPESAAAGHGRMRAQDGFGVNQMVAEYRAMRASVLRLWTADRALTAAIREHFVLHPGDFDPRQYLKPAREAIKGMVQHKIKNVLNCSDRI